MDRIPDLTIIIVTYNSAKDIGPCLDSIFQTKGSVNLDVFVVDNKSKDQTLDVVRNGFPQVRAIALDDNIGFPAANNKVLPLASSRYVMLLNPDTLVMPKALSTLVDFMYQTPDCGVCGPTLLDKSGIPWPDLKKPSIVSILLNTLQLAGFYRKSRLKKNVEAISGACLVLRRSLIEEVGLLDKDLFWCEDVDYCLRVKSKGYRVCAVRKSQVIHFVGRSAKTNIGLVIENQFTSRLRFFKKNSSPMRTKAAWIILSVQALLRLAKWELISCLHLSPEADPRVRALHKALREMPKIMVRKKISHEQ